MSLCVLPSRVSVSAQSWQRVASVDQVKPVTVTSFLPSALQSASHFHSHHCIFLNTHSSISKSATFFCTHFIHSFSHDTVFLCNVFFSPLLTRSSDNSLHCVRLVCVSFPLVSTRLHSLPLRLCPTNTFCICHRSLSHCVLDSFSRSLASQLPQETL